LGISRRSVVVLATLDNSINGQSMIYSKGTPLLRCVEQQQRALLGFLKTLSSQIPKTEGQKGTHSGLRSRAGQPHCRRDVTTTATVVLLNIDDFTWGLGFGGGDRPQEAS
jgi:hypothetical protein